MKKTFIALALTFSSVSSFAGLPEMMKVYNNPKIAPKIATCRGDSYCNGFIALAKQWRSIPNSYRYEGINIKSYAKQGVSYDNQGRSIGLYHVFVNATNKDKTHRFMDSLDTYIEAKGHVPFEDDGGYEAGLAVLIYIEDKNGWASKN